MRIIDKNRNMYNNLMNNQILCLWYASPMKKVENFEIKNKYVLMNDENNFFDEHLST